MKMIFCTMCGDIRGLRDGQDVWCKCFNCCGRWTDAQRGIAQVWADDRTKLRVLGLNNSLLMPAIKQKDHDWNNKNWREYTDILLADCVGYLFHKDSRNSPIVVLIVGQSNDVTWMKEEPQRY